MRRKKKRIGRPPLPKGQAKGGRLFCRLSEAEAGEIEAAAKRAEKSKSEWIRETLLARAREGKPVA
jgi:hypothetical protein